VTDIVEQLRSDAAVAEQGEYPEDGCRWAITMRQAADEIERLRLFEYYANNPIEGMVEEAVAYKKQHGKHPFED
jgi:hypothetical protein